MPNMNDQEENDFAFKKMAGAIAECEEKADPDFRITPGEVNFAVLLGYALMLLAYQRGEIKAENVVAYGIVFDLIYTITEKAQKRKEAQANDDG